MEREVTYEEMRHMPIAIRGHHLRNIAFIADHLILNDQPVYTKAFLEQGLEDDVPFMIAMSDYAQIYTSSILIENNDEYTRDVFGEGIDERSQALDDAYRYVSNFFTASGSATTFVTASPDGLCGSCVLGAHCSVLLDDFKFIQDLTDNLTQHNISFEIIERLPMTEEFEFLYNKPTSIKTELKNVRAEVLRLATEISPWESIDFIEPLQQIS